MKCKETSSKRCRTRFDLWQIQRLEQVFHETHYPDSQQISYLVNQTNIPMPKMLIWFQNRRAKWRKNKRLKNFGGLASVKETAYVPAPNHTNAFQSHLFKNNIINYNYYDNLIKCTKNSAIDLQRKPINDLYACYQPLSSLFNTYFYKKFAGNTRIGSNDYNNDYNNDNNNDNISGALSEYPNSCHHRWYYNMNNNNDITTQPVIPLIYASNQQTTALLFASQSVWRLHTIEK